MWLEGLDSSASPPSPVSTLASSSPWTRCNASLQASHSLRVALVVSLEVSQRRTAFVVSTRLCQELMRDAGRAKPSSIVLVSAGSSFAASPP